MHNLETIIVLVLLAFSFIPHKLHYTLTLFRSRFILLLLLLLKKVGSARLRESGTHPISPKTPAPQYQPIDRMKRNGKQ